MKKTISLLMCLIVVAVAFVVDSCSKSSSLPAIGGFNSSNDIQKTNLVAHWSFEGNFNESVQSLTPTVSSTAPTYTTGIKGQAYKGGGDSYISCPIGNLATIPSVTLSVWYKQPAQPVNNTTSSYIAGQGAQGMVQMYNASGTFYVLEFANEPYAPKSGDSLKFDAGFQSKTSGQYGPNEGVVPVVFGTNSLNKWTHLVMTYDGTSSTYTVYQDGNVIGANSAWSSAKTAAPVVILDGPPGSGAPLGNLALSTPIGLTIGAFPQVLNIPADNLTPQPWSGNWQGGLDEIRIYKVALSASEVGALYQLESTGR
jgi:hypothetical protein